MNPNTKSRFKGQADDIVSSANRRITEDKKILKDIKGGILDKNDPKVRKRFETEAKDRIEKDFPYLKVIAVQYPVMLRF